MHRTVAGFIRKMKEQELTVAFAESVTCGLAAHMLCSSRGTSEIFPGGVVCYNERTKTGFLGVKKSLLKKYTAESMQASEALAIGLKKLIPADIHVGITGLDAPGGSETAAKPVGTLFFYVLYQKRTFKLKKVIRGTPLEIRKKACIELFGFLVKKVLT